MALATATIWEVRATATTGNVNGGGFNTANANFPTDLTTDTNTANTAAPIVSSATYTFAASDVSAWLYVKSGTNWTAGWYQIASVAGGKATLNAAVGAAIQVSTTTFAYNRNTVVGCATVGTPTAGTFGIDYSQQDTAQATATDYSSIGSSSTLTSVSGGFTRMMVGNIFHQTTTGTGAFGVVGWYEIVNFTDANTVTLDRTPNSGTASVNCTGFIGGAGRLNGLEDAFYEQLPSGSRVWIKSGSYTISAAISIISANGTAANPIVSQGYTSFRGDTCNGSDRPLIISGTANTVFGSHNHLYNLSFNMGSTGGLQLVTLSKAVNCKLINSSSSTNRVAVTAATNCALIGCEVVSQRGNAVSATGVAIILGCYIHDCAIGVVTSSNIIATGNLFESCGSSAIYLSGVAPSTIVSNTFYGREAKIGTGITIDGGINTDTQYIYNNIFYGLTTGINETLASTIRCNNGQFNDFFNNTTDVLFFEIGGGNYAVNPQFVNATQITGSTATTTGSTLTQAGGDFSTVTDNVDYLHVLSGTGVTVARYLITGHTGTTLTTNNALGTSNTGDVVYFVGTGHNFAVGTNLKSIGFPGFGGGLETTGYPDVGAVQRQEAGGGSFTFS